MMNGYFNNRATIFEVTDDRHHIHECELYPSFWAIETICFDRCGTIDCHYGDLANYVLMSPKVLAYHGCCKHLILRQEYNHLNITHYHSIHPTSNMKAASLTSSGPSFPSMLISYRARPLCRTAQVSIPEHPENQHARAE